MKQNIVLSATIISLLFFSCAKEGPQGIPGPQGNGGAQGAAGAVGPAGQDGSIIYSGNGAPASTVGKNGDYYLDDNTGNLYGPKTASGWGTPVSLRGSGSTQGPAGPAGPAGPQGPAGSQGPQGAAGTPGSKIYSGTGAPAASLGTNGDFYLDKQSYLLYGPKTNNVWGTPILLQGAQGIQGPQGPAGVPGSQILSGNGAPSAAIGNTGDYYLDKSTGNFYGPKTASGWGSPISLKGANGAQGPAGPQGSQGAAGTPGSQIYSGSTAPPSNIGIAGDYYIDTIHAIIYGPKTASGWPSTGLSLQVNNVITYEFDNHVRNSLPYSWQVYQSQLQASIWLPYNNATAQTTGFTIPQAIVDHGIVLCYIRYFLSVASDTATSAGMTPWMELPYSISTNVGNGVSSVYTLSTYVDVNGFRIIVNSIQNSFSNFTGAFIPSQIRVVLIPSGQSTVITRANPSVKSVSAEYKINHIGRN